MKKTFSVTWIFSEAFNCVPVIYIFIVYFLPQSVDALITSIFHVDLFSFVRIASEKLSNWWFIAHFTNLLNHIYPGVLNDLQLTHKQDELSLESCPKTVNCK